MANIYQEKPNKIFFGITVLNKDSFFILAFGSRFRLAERPFRSPARFTTIHDAETDRRPGVRILIAPTTSIAIRNARRQWTPFVRFTVTVAIGIVRAFDFIAGCYKILFALTWEYIRWCRSAWCSTAAAAATASTRCWCSAATATATAWCWCSTAAATSATSAADYGRRNSPAWTTTTIIGRRTLWSVGRSGLERAADRNQRHNNSAFTEIRTARQCGER